MAILVAIFLACLSLTLGQLDLECRVKKQANKKFYGNVIATVYVDLEIDCSYECWRYKKEKSCYSVNWQETTRRCELMSDTVLLPDTNSGSLMSFPFVTYMEPVVCTGSKPKPTDEPEVTEGTTRPTRPPTGPSTNTPTSTTTIKSGTCGQTAVPNKVTRFHRIVGGVEARPHSMPYIVSLRSPRSNFHFCGGTLVRVSDKDESDIVITASHCMEETTSVKIVAGAHYANEESDGEVSSMGAEVVLHPSYNYPVPTNNDIAIIRLSKPIKFSDTIQPACLPAPKEQMTDGTNLIVSGWGVTRENGISPEALQQVTVPVVNPAKCMSQYGRGQIVAETMLCAGYDAGMKDACQGDSGGPLVSNGPGGYTLHGVVSFGNGCARARAPGIYARVSNYIDWIQKQIKTLSRVA